MNCPVALFAYRRIQHLRLVVKSLQENTLASETDLFIFCDGAKSPDDVDAVTEVRSFCRRVSGFRSVTVIERDHNLGLSASIVDGVSQLCNEYGFVAVVEDDVIVSRHFLSWVNAALKKYEHDTRVFSVGCYVFPTDRKLENSFFLSLPDCWGWAVWGRSWKFYQADGASLLRELKARNLQRKFDFDGAFPYTDMLKKQIEGKNDSWAIRWSASVLLAGGLTVYPGKSMTQNIGFDGTGTHCGENDIYDQSLSETCPDLQDIPVVESDEAREAWRDFLLKLKRENIRDKVLSRVVRKIKRLLK
ncbi:hypothetical protein TH468_07710 [Thalassospira sp. MCCC 1A03138]|nr:hypothetical protein TH468_07710 [Thalassospira sp. MCCC 1A03138]